MDIRWQQRFENFEKAYMLLKENADYGFSQLSELERMGCIQAFEITFELAWKTMKDYMLFKGLDLLELSPRAVIREAFAAKIISDGQAWLDMLNDRNLTTHTYDDAHIQNGLELIHKNYIPHLSTFHSFLKKQTDEH